MCSYRGILGAKSIIDKCKSSIGGVVSAPGIEEERSGADSSVHHGLICRKERSRSNGCVVISQIIVLERKETSGRIESAGCETQKGIFPFRCIGTRVAAVGWWDDGLRRWQNRDGEECESDDAG